MFELVHYGKHYNKKVSTAQVSSGSKKNQTKASEFEKPWPDTFSERESLKPNVAAGMEKKDGATDWTRTSTAFLPIGPKPIASTNFATVA